MPDFGRHFLAFWNDLIFHRFIFWYLQLVSNSSSNDWQKLSKSHASFLPYGQWHTIIFLRSKPICFFSTIYSKVVRVDRSTIPTRSVFTQSKILSHAISHGLELKFMWWKSLTAFTKTNPVSFWWVRFFSMWITFWHTLINSLCEKFTQVENLWSIGEYFEETNLTCVKPGIVCVKEFMCKSLWICVHPFLTEIWGEILELAFTKRTTVINYYPLEWQASGRIK